MCCPMGLVNYMQYYISILYCSAPAFLSELYILWGNPMIANMEHKLKKFKSKT